MRSRDVKSHHAASQRGQPSVCDPFSKMPIEIILQIAEHLSVREICSWSTASFSAAYSLNNMEMWSRRIREDSPWLWDFDPLKIVTHFQMINSTDTVHWPRVYLHLQDIGEEGDPGITNRKRIWVLCENIWYASIKGRSKVK